MALPIPTSDAVADEPVSDNVARDITVEAYVYFYPLITMDITRRQASGDDSSSPVARSAPGDVDLLRHVIRESPVSSPGPRYRWSIAAPAGCASARAQMSVILWYS
jgi:hypothetical protein